jgi:hypothetical protein
MHDDLRSEYDFRALRVVARGPALTVSLAADVAQTFPDSDAVNEALRLLIRIAKDQVNTGNSSAQAGGRALHGARQKQARR